MYKVRVKKYEKKNWKTIAEFSMEEDAITYANKLDKEWFQNFGTEPFHIDIEYPDGSYYIVA